MTNSDFIYSEDIPQFPHSTLLSLKHHFLLNKILFPHTLMSEYSFTSLMPFAHIYKYALTYIDNTVFVIGIENDIPFALMLCQTIQESIIATLIENNYVIKGIPRPCKNHIKSVLQTMSKNVYATLTANEGDFDYIHKKNNLATLPGRKFHKKRNHVNQFIKQYSYITIKLTQQTIPDALYVLDIWQNHHKNLGDYKSTKFALEHFQALDYVGEITFIDKKPAGFILAEMRNNNNWAIIHFEKANIEYKGLFQFINWHFSQNLPQECTVINREQDLQDEGLRQAKQTYRPDALLPKYRVYPYNMAIPQESNIIFTTEH